MSDDDDVAAVQAANQAFYDAFEARDLDAMSALWERSERALCTHPGWATLRGWAQVASSWFALFQNGQRLQFILTEEHVSVAGDVAWVGVDENIIDAGPGELAGGGSTVAAVNVFVRSGANLEWRLVVHHASVVSSAGGPGVEGG